MKTIDSISLPILKHDSNDPIIYFFFINDND